jgi:hypothetical protein
MKAPLRLVVDWFNDPETGAQKERLECGHVITRKQDIYGYTNAVRRRCRHCAREAEAAKEVTK